MVLLLNGALYQGENMNKKVLAFLAVLVIVLLALAGCISKPSTGLPKSKADIIVTSEDLGLSAKEKASQAALVKALSGKFTGLSEIVDVSYADLEELDSLTADLKNLTTGITTLNDPNLR